MPHDRATPLGRVMVLDIESAPDPAAVAIAGRGDQIARIALHRVVAYSALHAQEDTQGDWTGLRLESMASEAETPMLAAISADVAALRDAGGLLVSYNGLAHDVEVIRRRIHANWAFHLEGIAALDDVNHLDMMRGGGSRGPLISLRDACAALGISVDPLKVPIGRDAAPATVRKGQVDVAGTFLLLLHELAGARRSTAPLAAGWQALSDHLGQPGVRAPHLEQFRLPALLSSR